MGSPAAAAVVVGELCHARGELLGDDLVGLVSMLPLGGSGLLHADNYEVHLPRATTMAFASHVKTARVPAATTVKWRVLVETRVRTLLVMTAGEGYKWGDTARCAEVPIPADGDSSDEGLPASDHSESDGSEDDASSDGVSSSDVDQGGDATGENPNIFALRVAMLNVCGYQRKKMEVLATAPQGRRASSHRDLVLNPGQSGGGRPRPVGVGGERGGREGPLGPYRRLVLGSARGRDRRRVRLDGEIPREGLDPSRSGVRHP